MGFNWPKMATIEPRGTIWCIVNVIDIIKELMLKIKKICKKYRPLGSFIPFALTEQKWLKKEK